MTMTETDMKIKADAHRRAMAAADPNARIYQTDFIVGPQDKAAQIRHLARIGIAATATNANVRDLHTSLASLFEVMFRLAEEVEAELEEAEAAK